MKTCRNQKGFTLIEIISVMVVVTISGVVAGMGLVKIAEGFVFAKKNAATAQKGQIAMARIAKELNAVKSISSGSGTSITFTRTTGESHTISLSGTELRVDTDVLVDNVNTFEIKYYSTYNASPSTTYSSSAAMIQISLKLTGAGDVLSEFIDRVTL